MAAVTKQASFSTSTIQPRITSDVTSNEWRWVIVVGGLLSLITLLPYVLAFSQATAYPSLQFNGILVNPQDGATYLAKIAEGMRGQWLFTIAHTSESTSGTFLFEFYLFLGHLGGFLGFSPLLTFHIARIAASFVMYMAFYTLAAEIWQQQQARRLFFLVMSIGSGLGWLSLVLAPSVRSVDLFVPEAFPFYSTFITPHFAAAFALLALLTAVFIHAFRPGSLEMPSFQNGGVLVVPLSVALALILPQAWLPFVGTLVIYLILSMIERRRLPSVAIQRWVILALLPAGLVGLYDFAIVNASPLYAIWNAQNQTLAGAPINYVFGYGLLILIGLPALIRAVRRMEQDGDRLMLIWLVVTVILIYAPSNIQRRFSTGLILPLAYFATRALVSFWALKVRTKSRTLLWVILFVPLAISNALILVLPMHGLSDPKAGLQAGQLIPADYAQAMAWLRPQTTPDTIVLAPPSISVWVPADTGARVVYGHPLETLNAFAKLAQVSAWYAGQGCSTLLSQYHVRFVLVGNTMTSDNGTVDPFATSPCTSLLGKPIATFNTVTVYDASSITTF